MSKKIKHTVWLWNGQSIDCEVVKKFWCLTLISYEVDVYEGTTYFYTQYRLKYYPSWRIYEKNGSSNV